jgi:hypothetical protein
LLAIPAIGKTQSVAVAQIEMPARVEIQSEWNGYSPDSPLATDLTLKLAGDHYDMVGINSRGKRAAALVSASVPTNDVLRLVEAMRQESQPEFTVGNLGVTDEDLQKQIDAEINGNRNSRQSTEVTQELQSYRESLRKPDVLAAILTTGFRQFHTDDYPGVRIRIEFPDGTQLAASSRSQQYLMLPWNRGGMQTTYSTAIPEALAKILPDGATNKARLQGPVNDTELRELVSAALFDPLNGIVAKGRAGEALRVLEANFEVKTPKAQEPVSAIGLGKVLFASLRLPEGPSNLSMRVRLPLEGNALKEPSGDVARIKAALALAQSSPGMARVMREHPDEKFRMQDRFGWAWLDQRTARQFVLQMQQLKKLPELQSDPSLMHGAVMVEEGNAPAYWIVLPDRRAVLWKEFSDAPATGDTLRCQSVPMGDEDDDEDFLGAIDTDLCIGKVYSATGEELQERDAH